MRHWRRVLCYESTRQKCFQRFWTRPHILVKVKESRLNGHWLAGLLIFHLLEDHSWFRWRSHSFWGSVFQCWPFSGHISDYFRVFSFLVFSSWSVPKCRGVLFNAPERRGIARGVQILKPRFTRILQGSSAKHWPRGRYVLFQQFVTNDIIWYLIISNDHPVFPLSTRTVCASIIDPIPLISTPHLWDLWIDRSTRQILSANQNHGSKMF
jgi:hypothetical protein